MFQRYICPICGGVAQQKNGERRARQLGAVVALARGRADMSTKLRSLRLCDMVVGMLLIGLGFVSALASQRLLFFLCVCVLLMLMLMLMLALTTLSVVLLRIVPRTGARANSSHSLFRWCCFAWCVCCCVWCCVVVDRVRGSVNGASEASAGVVGAAVDRVAFRVKLRFLFPVRLCAWPSHETLLVKGCSRSARNAAFLAAFMAPMVLRVC